MEFRLLGALDVRDEGRTLELRGSKRRTVLAPLVLHANEVIRSDRLIDELWGGLASTGAFDTFHATADSVACHGAPLPPRKRRKRSNAYMPMAWYPLST
jgi:hypothetical protein